MNSIFTFKTFLFWITLLATVPVWAVPVNDECSSATVLNHTSQCSYTSGTNVYATASSYASSCAGTANDDVWYQFVANGTSAYITVQGSSSFDAVIELLDGCNGTSLGCSDNTGMGGSERIATTGLNNGQTYFVRVYHYYSTPATTNTFDICVSSASVPYNDNCTDAYSLTPSVSCSYSPGSTYGATYSGIASGCGGTAEDDVWYFFTATGPSMTLKVQGSSSFDAVVEVFSACGGTSLFCVDSYNAGGLETVNMTGLTKGQDYYVRVFDYGFGTTASSTFQICLTAPLPAPPVNDECSQAITIGGMTCTTVNGTTAGATQSSYASACGGTANDDVWYKFVANGQDAHVIVKGISNFDAVVEVLDACSGNSLKCSDATATNGEENFFLDNLMDGSTYLIRVYDYYAKDNYDNSFSICVSYSAPLTNDECINASPLTVTKSKNTLVSGTTDGATRSTYGCTGTSDDDVWYQFVASSTEDSIYVHGASSFDAVIALYDACGGSVLTCTDNTGMGGEENMYTSGLTVGNTYYLQVYHYYSGSGSTPTFDIAVYNGAIVTAFKGISSQTTLDMHPNPATSIVDFDLSKHSGNISIEFFDAQGQLMKREQLSARSEYQSTIDFLKEGIYTVRVVSDGLISTGKLVVVK